MTVPVVPALRFDMLEPLQPSNYLVHFYGHELGDLERVEFTESLSAATQLIRRQLANHPSWVQRVEHDPSSGHLSFLMANDTVFATVQPCAIEDTSTRSWGTCLASIEGLRC